MPEFVMRRAAELRIAAGLAFVAFALTAYALRNLLLGAPLQAAHGLGWLVIAAMASGWAAKLTAPVSLFGLKARLSAPLILAFVAPYCLRFKIWDAIASRLPGRRPEAPAPKRPPASPYALPARVAVALAAAARARK
jgi:hypothetical protein